MLDLLCERSCDFNELRHADRLRPSRRVDAERVECRERAGNRLQALAEHLARKILQQQKDIGRNPTQPDFTGLEEYERHAAGATGEMHAPDWDKYVSDIQRNRSLIARNRRLEAEERELAAAAPKKGARAGKNGSRKGADLDEEEH